MIYSCYFLCVANLLVHAPYIYLSHLAKKKKRESLSPSKCSLMQPTNQLITIKSFLSALGTMTSSFDFSDF